MTESNLTGQDQTKQTRERRIGALVKDRENLLKKLSVDLADLQRKVERMSVSSHPKYIQDILRYFGINAGRIVALQSKENHYLYPNGLPKQWQFFAKKWKEIRVLALAKRIPVPDQNFLSTNKPYAGK